MHSLFLNEHNRIAKILLQKHSDWNDELLFNETRKIVIAEFQNIVYNEYLPLILGDEFTNQDFDLALPISHEGTSVYDPSVRLRVYIEELS